MARAASARPNMTTGGTRGRETGLASNPAMNIDMIHAAAERIGTRARRTPLLTSPFLDELAGRPVYVNAGYRDYGCFEMWERRERE